MPSFEMILQMRNRSTASKYQESFLGRHCPLLTDYRNCVLFGVLRSGMEKGKARESLP